MMRFLSCPELGPATPSPEPLATPAPNAPEVSAPAVCDWSVGTAVPAAAVEVGRGLLQPANSTALMTTAQIRTLLCIARLRSSWRNAHPYYQTLRRATTGLMHPNALMHLEKVPTPAHAVPPGSRSGAASPARRPIRSAACRWRRRVRHR